MRDQRLIETGFFFSTMHSRKMFYQSVSIVVSTKPSRTTLLVKRKSATYVIFSALKCCYVVKVYAGKGLNKTPCKNISGL
jgi:hypothetical protein